MALVDLTHAFVPAMVERKEGGVINVASIAAFQPVPYQAVYGATNNSVLSLRWGKARSLCRSFPRIRRGTRWPDATEFFVVARRAVLSTRLVKPLAKSHGDRRGVPFKVAWEVGVT